MNFKAQCVQNQSASTDMKLCTHEGLTLNDVTKNMLQERPLWIKKLRFYKVDDVTHSEIL